MITKSWKGSDTIMDEPNVKQVSKKAWETLELSEGPITRGRMKKFKDGLQGFLKRDCLNSKEEWMNNYGILFEESNNGIFNVIQVLENQEDKIEFSGSRSRAAARPARARPRSICASTPAAPTRPTEQQMRIHPSI